MSKFSYVGTGIEDAIRIVPYAQIVNPIKHPHIGFAIKKDQAELAGFQPDKTWKLDKVMLGDDSQECYLCSTPRLLVLGRSELLMVRDTEIVKYNPNLKEQGFKALSYIIALFVGENNEPLSGLPFRIKTSSMAGKSFRDNYAKWQGQLLSAYKFHEGTTDGLSWSAGVFQPTFRKGQVMSPDGKKISISEVDSFIAITSENLEKNFILPDSKLGQSLPKLKELTKDWCDLVRVKEEYAPIPEEFVLDRQATILEINSKFQGFGMNSEEISEFISARFEGNSVSVLDDNDLVSLNSYLDLEAVNSQSVPF